MNLITCCWVAGAQARLALARRFALGLALGVGVQLASAPLAHATKPAGKAASAAAPKTAPTKVKFVRQSREPMSGMLLFAHQLPRTFSVDPLTPQEILDVQKTYFERSDDIDPTPPTSNKKFSPSWSLSPSGCMQWLFIRHQRSEPWQAVGAEGAGGAVVKVNGLLRRPSLNYTIRSTQDETKKYSWEKPGTEGGGVSSLTYLTGQSTMKALKADYESNNRMNPVDPRTGLKVQAGFLDLLRVGGLRVSEERMACTHMRANCRQYAGKVLAGNAYVIKVDHELHDERGKRETVAVEVDPSLATELAIEDMCPFATNAMVQRPLNARLGGGSDLFKYSFPENPGLRSALRPFVMGAR